MKGTLHETEKEMTELDYLTKLTNRLTLTYNFVPFKDIINYKPNVTKEVSIRISDESDFIKNMSMDPKAFQEELRDQVILDDMNMDLGLKGVKNMNDNKSTTISEKS